MKSLSESLKMQSGIFHPVVKFNPSEEKLISLDFTEKNKDLQKIDLADTAMFSNYINKVLQKANAKFGFGGYNELRTLYTRSNLFNKDLSAKDDQTSNEEPRRLHLGTDVWGKAGTEIFAPCDGVIHSFAFNDNFGDYGATIILSHESRGLSFYTLYGHLSLKDLDYIKKGDYINSGQKFAHFGNPEENGHWPPHLHFQVIQDIQSYKGDYPGVCKFSERKKYLANCPDPDIILQLRRFLSCN